MERDIGAAQIAWQYQFLSLVKQNALGSPHDGFRRAESSNLHLICF